MPDDHDRNVELVRQPQERLDHLSNVHVAVRIGRESRNGPGETLHRVEDDQTNITATQTFFEEASVSGEQKARIGIKKFDVPVPSGFPPRRMQTRYDGVLCI